ncbi:hypothetical protein HELRODRAFT_153610, partial [Helobdella robusta]|uniref:RING-type E3 ubiquitin transferase n=1 Tax=Helobdella robusta TaxID=6412 RepID=T1EL97_HELRO
KFQHDECCICLEKFTDNTLVHELNCTHMLHAWCSRQWLLMKTSCPLCRSEVVRL